MSASKSTQKRGNSKVSSFLFDKYLSVKILIFVISVLIFVLPFLKLIYMSFQDVSGFTFSHYQNIFSMERTWRVLANTFIMVLGATILASLCGVLFAWLMAYTDIRHKKILHIFLFLPFIIPSYVSSLAWIQFFGQNGQLAKWLGAVIPNFRGFNLYSMTGMIVVLGITTYPLVYLFTLNAFRQIPRETELAARVSGASQWLVLRKVTLPMAMPGLTAGIFIAFLSCLDNFGIPAFLGSSANITVLTTFIYQQVIGFGPSAFNQAAVLSVILSLIALIGLGIQRLLLARHQQLESQVQDHSIRYYLGAKRSWIEVGMVLFIIITSILPLFALIISPLYKVMGRPLTLENLSFKNYLFIFQSVKSRQAILTSLKLAGVTAILSLGIGTILAYYRVRKKLQLASFIESAATIPYALPGTVFALSMIFAWMQPLPGWNPGIYGSIFILYIAYFTRFFSLQVRSSVASFQQLDVSIEEAAQVSGSPIWVKWRRILLPLIKQTILSGATLVFLTSLTELTVSSLLYASKSQTIGVSVLSFQQAGNLRHANAFSSLIVLLIMFTYLIGLLLNRFRGKGGKNHDNSD